VEMAQKTAIHWAISRGYLPIDSIELSAALGAEPEATRSPATKPASTGAISDYDPDEPGSAAQEPPEPPRNGSHSKPPPVDPEEAAAADRAAGEPNGLFPETGGDRNAN